MLPPASGAEPAPALTEPTAEAGLLARLRAAEEPAFEELVRRYGGALLAAVRPLLPCPEDAADAVQEAFVSAVRALPSFEGRSALATWLHRIAVNHALMLRRKQKRLAGEKVESLLPEFTGAGGHYREPPGRFAGPASGDLEREELRQWVRDGIARLPASYRNAVMMRDIEGMELRDVAEQLRITVNAAKIRVHRGRQALRELLVRASVAHGL